MLTLKNITGLLVKEITPVLHRNDFLIKSNEDWLKEIYRGYCSRFA